jgi:predicted DNA-binding antitoxin AbrB/MazE fold protein
MSVITYEAIVKDGVLQLLEPVHLPENTRVYVVVPEAERETCLVIRAPRLKDRNRASEFTMEVS